MATTSLEQQALDRAARMYSAFDRRQGASLQQDRPPGPPPAPKPEPPAPPTAPKPPQKPAEKPPGLLDALMEDKEQSLLMLLLVILMKDGADMNALLALMYILL